MPILELRKSRLWKIKELARGPPAGNPEGTATTAPPPGTSVMSPLVTTFKPRLEDRWAFPLHVWHPRTPHTPSSCLIPS